MTDLQWKIFGLAFQAMFMGRFLVQWIASERAKKSVIPKAFWYFSIIGSSGLLVYATVHLQDPVFAIGQSTGFAIYLRNLVLIDRSSKAENSKRGEVSEDSTPRLGGQGDEQDSPQQTPETADEK